jgi:hypothetical protein
VHAPGNTDRAGDQLRRSRACFMLTFYSSVKVRDHGGGTIPIAAHLTKATLQDFHFFHGETL